MNGTDGRTDRSVYRIDLQGILSRDELYDYLEDELPFPAYFGRNLDAVHDVLTEYGRNWTIHFLHLTDIEVMMPRYMEKFRDMCADAMQETEGLEIIFDDDRAEK